MKVDYTQLSLASQVLERQGGHSRAMEQYLRTEAALSPFDMGLLLMALYPINLAAVELGAGAYRVLGSILDDAAAGAAATLDDYIAGDQQAYEAFARLVARLGGQLPPFSDPRSSMPPLGPATSSADSSYGAGEPDIFSQAAEEGGDLGDFIRSRVERAGERIDGWSNGSGGVVERSDPSSYLVPPVGQTSEVAELRWSCGIVLGGVDWLFEQLFGFSLIADVIMKPFTGNWEAIDEASIAWSHVGDATLELGANVSGLPDGLDGWEGRAADAFRLAMAALSAASVALSYASDFVSGLVGTVATVAKAAASAIGFAINRISKHLLILAAEAAVPIAGWISGAIHAVVIVNDIIGGVRLIYTLVDLIYDAIYDLIAAKEKLVDVAFIVEDLVEAFARGAARAVTA